MTMIKYTPEELQVILTEHSEWLKDYTKGKQANLRHANLQDADLQEANLQGANLQYANLYCANLQDADLQEANLQEANLQYANLYCANLQDADLQYANLYCANLQGANLQGANLRFISVGDSSRIFCMNSPRYQIVITENIIAIGCQQHLTTLWESFEDTAISGMDVGALSWWRVWKPIVLGYHSTLFGSATNNNKSDVE